LLHVLVLFDLVLVVANVEAPSNDIQIRVLVIGRCLGVVMLTDLQLTR
jgi:hypothetical protein